MITIDTDQLIETFLDQAQRYVQTRDFLLALDLDDTTAKLMQAAGFHLQNPPLVGKLHDFRRAVREQQIDTLPDLFAEIREMLPAQP